MRTVFEQKIDAHEATESEIFSHVRQKACELQELVLDRQSHPVFEAAQVCQDLFPDRDETCLHLEYRINLCVEMLSLILIVSTG